MSFPALIDALIKNDIVQKGEFTLKSGKKSNLYFDLRRLPSHPNLFKNIIKAFGSSPDIDCVCGVPSAGIALATAYSLEYNIPMIWCRKQPKEHGLKKIVEGEYKKGNRVLLIEDVITTGGSILETINNLEEVGLKVVKIKVLVDRREIKDSNLKEKYPIESLFYDFDFLKQIPFYGLQSEIIRIMHQKKSNLVFSADLYDLNELIHLLHYKQIARKAVIIKVHIDSVVNPQLYINQLLDLAIKYDFIIMEDRKLSDIGNTVKNQFLCKENKIYEWANLVTIHLNMGPGILQALQNSVSSFENKIGFVPVVQASSKDNLMDINYTTKCLEMMKEYKNIIPAIVCQNANQIRNILKINKHHNDRGMYLFMTPGVHLDSSSDQLGQQYRSVKDAIFNEGNDLIIVGRGIYNSSNPLEIAEKYRENAWEAYLQRISNN